jgi:ribosomal protein S27E
MAESFQCPKCAKRYALQAGLAGKQAKCRQCGYTFRVPAGGSAAVLGALPPAASSELSIFDEPIPAPMPPGTYGPRPLAPMAGVAPTPMMPTPSMASYATPPMPSFAAPAMPAAPVSGVFPGGSSYPSMPPLPPPPTAAKRRGFAGWFYGDIHARDRRSLHIGLAVVVLGAVGLLLPLVGYQFNVVRMAGIGRLAPYLAVFLGAVGLAVVLVSMRRNMAVGIPLALILAAVLLSGFFVSPKGTAAPPGPLAQGNAAPQPPGPAPGPPPNAGVAPQPIPAPTSEVPAATTIYPITILSVKRQGVFGDCVVDYQVNDRMALMRAFRARLIFDDGVRQAECSLTSSFEGRQSVNVHLVGPSLRSSGAKVHVWVEAGEPGGLSRRQRISNVIALDPDGTNSPAAAPPSPPEPADDYPFPRTPGRIRPPSVRPPSVRTAIPGPSILPEIVPASRSQHLIEERSSSGFPGQ